MKTATILPQNYLEYSRNDDYFICLAHLIGQAGFEAYTQFFIDRAKEGKYVILDNGACEGALVPLCDLVSKAKLIGASEVVAPDSFNNGRETLKMLIDDVPYLRENLPDVNIMAVVHGVDEADWANNARTTLSLGVDCLGVPKVLCKDNGMFARLNALSLIADELLDREVHLLGCWDNPLEIGFIERSVRNGELAPVRGTDSAIAYVYASGGKYMDSASRPNIPVNFKEGCVASEEILTTNIQMWRHLGDARVVPQIRREE